MKTVPTSGKRLNIFIRRDEHKKLEPDHYIFCNRHGGQLLYDNMRRDYQDLCKAAGIEKVGAFHRFRHHFGSNYIKAGGNVFELSDQLGHAYLKTTRIYVTIDEEQLERTNAKTSILGNWRKKR